MKYRFPSPATVWRSLLPGCPCPAPFGRTTFDQICSRQICPGGRGKKHIKGGSPYPPDPGTRNHRYRCSLPGLTGFTTSRRGGTDTGYRWTVIVTIYSGKKQPNDPSSLRDKPIAPKGRGKKITESRSATCLELTASRRLALQHCHPRRGH